jgi:hypothetical protein
MILEQNMKQSTWKNRYILGASGAENGASVAGALTANGHQKGQSALCGQFERDHSEAEDVVVEEASHPQKQRQESAGCGRCVPRKGEGFGTCRRHLGLRRR